MTIEKKRLSLRMMFLNIPTNIQEFGYKMWLNGKKKAQITYVENEDKNKHNTDVLISSPYNLGMFGNPGSFHCRKAYSETNLLSERHKRKEYCSKQDMQDIIENDKKQANQVIKESWEYLEAREIKVELYEYKNGKRTLITNSLEGFEKWAEFTESSSASA